MEFTYVIKSVNNNFNVMELEYSSGLRDTILVSAPLPYGELSVDDIAEIYAPIQHWELKDRVYKEVQVGHVGQSKPKIDQEPLKESPKLKAKKVK